MIKETVDYADEIYYILDAEEYDQGDEDIIREQTKEFFDDFLNFKIED